MHQIGYIHRDLKPANIMVGLGKKENIIYLIDYGLAKKKSDVAYMPFST
jgi:serine/threonine protein kinase